MRRSQSSDQNSHLAKHSLIAVVSSELDNSEVKLPHFAGDLLERPPPPLPD